MLNLNVSSNIITFINLYQRNQNHVFINKWYKKHNKWYVLFGGFKINIYISIRLQRI